MHISQQIMTDCVSIIKHLTSTKNIERSVCEKISENWFKKKIHHTQITRSPHMINGGNGSKSLKWRQKIKKYKQWRKTLEKEQHDNKTQEKIEKQFFLECPDDTKVLHHNFTEGHKMIVSCFKYDKFFL